jgi:hypothetical protein
MTKDKDEPVVMLTPAPGSIADLVSRISPTLGVEDGAFAAALADHYAVRVDTDGLASWPRDELGWPIVTINTFPTD